MSTIFSRIPAKVHYEPPKLVVRMFNNKQYYWNYATRKWTRLTRRCPYLG